MNTNTIAGPHHGPSRHRAGRTAASAVGPHIPTAASGEPQRSTGLRAGTPTPSRRLARSHSRLRPGPLPSIILLCWAPPKLGRALVLRARRLFCEVR